MNLPQKDILQEVVLSTKENAWINGSCFEFSLPTHMDFVGKNVKVGVKNIRFPELKRSIKVKLGFAHFLETFEDLNLKEFELDFKNFVDLSMQLEVIAFESLGIESGASLDFRNSKGNERDNSHFILSISYENDRVVVRKNINYILFIDDNLDKYLKFGAAKRLEIKGNVYWKLENWLHISDYCSNGKSENEIVHLAMYDIIQSSTWSANGSRYPIICTFYANNDNRGTNEFLAVKNVSVQFVKKVKCWFFNEFFENFSFLNYNLKSDPFMLTLVFFET